MASFSVTSISSSPRTLRNPPLAVDVCGPPVYCDRHLIGAQGTGAWRPLSSIPSPPPPGVASKRHAASRTHSRAYSRHAGTTSAEGFQTRVSPARPPPSPLRVPSRWGGRPAGRVGRRVGGRNAPVCGRAPSARRVFLGRWAACGAAGYARQSGNPAAHVSSVRPRAGAWAKPRSRHYCGRSPPPQAVRGGLDEATPGKSDWPGSASSLTSSAPPARPRPHSSRHPFPPPPAGRVGVVC